jgi:hypothetical protein
MEEMSSRITEGIRLRKVIKRKAESLQHQTMNGVENYY